MEVENMGIEIILFLLALGVFYFIMEVIRVVIDGHNHEHGLFKPVIDRTASMVLWIINKLKKNSNKRGDSYENI
jgi:hypothetical protein